MVRSLVCAELPDSSAELGITLLSDRLGTLSDIMDRTLSTTHGFSATFFFVEVFFSSRISSVTFNITSL